MACVASKMGRPKSILAVTTSFLRLFSSGGAPPHSADDDNKSFDSAAAATDRRPERGSKAEWASDAASIRAHVRSSGRAVASGKIIPSAGHESSTKDGIFAGSDDGVEDDAAAAAAAAAAVKFSDGEDSGSTSTDEGPRYGGFSIKCPPDAIWNMKEYSDFFKLKIAVPRMMGKELKLNTYWVCDEEDYLTDDKLVIVLAEEAGKTEEEAGKTEEDKMLDLMMGEEIDDGGLFIYFHPGHKIEKRNIMVELETDVVILTLPKED